jgi:NitT/TauT family transport system substrate-binding protein/putative hydroxymethylpyrimidine transport system substrate-binding protein
MLRGIVITLAALAAALTAGCGTDEPASAPVARLTLALDFVPNAVHAPLFVAVHNRRDREHGVDLEIRQPGGGPDSLKLVASGRAQLGVLDIHDLAIARERGIDVVAIGALVQRPLAALAARPGIERPRDLEGRTVGVSGLPSDPAFLKAIVSDDGGDPDKVKQVTIGFSAVTRILSGRVDAAPVFWNAEGVALRRKGLTANEFRVDDYGAPPYPEVVLITSRSTLREHEDDLRAALEAIAAGERDVAEHPEAAVKVVADAARTSDLGLVRAQLEAVRPLFDPPLRFDPAVLRRWAAFDERIGIVDRRPNVASAFDLSLAPDG